MPETNVMYVNLSPEVNRFVRSQAAAARLPLTAVLDALLREAMGRGWKVTGGAAVTETAAKEAAG
jgi:hypothetical protein